MVTATKTAPAKSTKTAATQKQKPHLVAVPQGDITIPLSLIDRFDDNPRRTLDPEGFEGLKGSIAAVGLLQAITVRPRDGGRFQVYIGSRRHRGLSELRDEGKIDADYQVKVSIRPATDEEAFKAAAIENITRQDMNPVEECEAIARMTGEKQLNYAGVASSTGLSVKAIEERLAVHRLPDPAKAIIEARKRSIAWGAILSEASETTQTSILDEIARQPMSYTSVEQLKLVIRRGRVAVSHAIFDVGAANIPTQGDLIAPEEAFFTDSEKFWEHQNKAINDLVDKLEAEGHDKVEIVRGRTFDHWNYEKGDTPKGAIAAVTVSSDGQVHIERNLVPLNQTREEEATAAGLFSDDIADVHEQTISEAPPAGKAAGALAEARRRAAALEIAHNTKVAKAIVVSQFLGDARSFVAPRTNFQDDHPTIAIARRIVEDLETAIGEQDPIIVLAGLEEATLDQALTALVALSMPLGGTKAQPFTANALPKVAIEAASSSIRRHWTPGEEFFEALSLAELRSLGRELLDESDAISIDSAVKRDAVRLLTDRFASAASQDQTLDPDREFLLATWTPSYL